MEENETKSQKRDYVYLYHQNEGELVRKRHRQNTDK